MFCRLSQTSKDPFVSWRVGGSLYPYRPELRSLRSHDKKSSTLPSSESPNKRPPVPSCERLLFSNLDEVLDCSFPHKPFVHPIITIQVRGGEGGGCRGSAGPSKAAHQSSSTSMPRVSRVLGLKHRCSSLASTQHVYDSRKQEKTVAINEMFLRKAPEGSAGIESLS